MAYYMDDWLEEHDAPEVPEPTLAEALDIVVDAAQN